jgi:hypothetical protein
MLIFPASTLQLLRGIRLKNSSLPVVSTNSVGGMSEGGAPFTKGELLAALGRSRDLCPCRVFIRNRLLSLLARKGKEFLQACTVACGQNTVLSFCRDQQSSRYCNCLRVTRSHLVRDTLLMTGYIRKTWRKW